MAKPQQATHERELQPHLRGPALLDTPTLNKGTAFTPEERREYGLEGLLPHAVETLDRQLERVMGRLDAKQNDLERYIYLIGLSDHNDDIQGTGSVALAGLTTALQIIDAPLTEQRILFLGAGSAAIGIADLIVSAMQAKGLSQDDARSRISMFDINGLIEPSRAGLSESQKVYAHKAEPSKDFVKTIEALKPTILIGVSAKGGAFNQRVVETMSRLNEWPIIFALSNPTDKAECTAEQAYAWSKGKALYAAGVQFPDVTVNGKTFHPGQANNFYITDENDALRDEGEAYADKMMQAGVSVTAVRYLGAIHDFVMLNPISDTTEARSAIQLANMSLRNALAGAGMTLGSRRPATKGKGSN